MRCCYFLGHVACRNLPWQGLSIVLTSQWLLCIHCFTSLLSFTGFYTKVNSLGPTRSSSTTVLNYFNHLHPPPPPPHHHHHHQRYHHQNHYFHNLHCHAMAILRNSINMIYLSCFNCHNIIYLYILLNINIVLLNQGLT